MCDSDIDGDGMTASDDSIRLLRYAIFPEKHDLPECMAVEPAQQAVSMPFSAVYDESSGKITVTAAGAEVAAMGICVDQAVSAVITSGKWSRTTLEIETSTYDDTITPLLKANMDNGMP